MTAIRRETLLRRRIIDAAAERTARTGWSSVTMSGLGAAVGVSRQTVYNEVGSKSALAESMVLHELAEFLVLVDRAFDDHPLDAVAAVRQAVRDILALAEANPLVRAILAGAAGPDSDLLPLLTTRSHDLLEMARIATEQRLAPLTPWVEESRRAAAVDVIVRTVLSHVTQSSGDPDTVADDVAWAAERMLSQRSMAMVGAPAM
jgi:AcrR family transcriptional regulator